MIARLTVIATGGSETAKTNTIGAKSQRIMTVLKLRHTSPLS